MKNKGFKIAKIIVAVISCILVLLVAILPIYKIKTIGGSSSEIEKVYFFTLFASTTSLDVKTISLGGLIAVLLFMLAPLFWLIDNKKLKFVGLALNLTMLSTATFFLQLFKQIKEQTSTSVELYSPGAIILLCASIILVGFSIADICVDYLGDKIANALKKNTKSVQELLDENEKLFKDGYITEAQRDERKAKILGL